MTQTGKLHEQASASAKPCKVKVPQPCRCSRQHFPRFSFQAGSPLCIRKQTVPSHVATHTEFYRTLNDPNRFQQLLKKREGAHENHFLEQCVCVQTIAVANRLPKVSGMQTLPDIDQLSDDELAQPPKKQLKPPQPRPVSRRAHKLAMDAWRKQVRAEACSPAKVRNLVSQKCPCRTQSCFTPFRETQKFDKLVALRKQMRDLGKVNRDRAAA